MKAKVKIPEGLQKSRFIQAHASSTFARLGMDVSIYQDEHQRLLRSSCLPKWVTVSLVNLGCYPFAVREGDMITLSDFVRILELPAISRDLHAAGTYLSVNALRLPKLSFSSKKGKSVFSYIDPRDLGVWQYTRTERFDELCVKPNDFVVLGAKESVCIPEDCIGVVRLDMGGAVSLSAVFGYPTWRGCFALEYQVLERMKIRPGDRIGVLTIHGSPNPLPPYRGRYNIQAAHDLAPK